MIGEKIKELRKEKGIYQKELAEALSVSKGAVAMWETNKRTPDIETIKRIADYFRISTDELLEISTPESDRTEKSASDDEIKFALFNGNEGITDEMFAEVKQFAEMVKLREESRRKGVK